MTLWTTVAVDLIGFGIVVPILPRYAQQFGVSATTIGFIFASFSVAQLLCAPLWGRLSDRVGRKPILIVSLFGTALGSVLTGLALGVPLLFLGRIIDGASGASVSVAQAAAADLAPPHQRARLMGLLGAAFGVGFVAGPAIGALGSLIGPNVPFFIAAAIAFVNALVALKRLPETATIDRHHDTAAEDAEAIAAAPTLDGPGIVEPAHLERAVTVDRRGIVRLIIVAFVAMVGFSGFEATFALLGEDRFAFTQATTGAVFTVIGVALVVVQGGLVGKVNDALGETTTLRVGLMANAIGLAVLAVNGGWATLVAALALLVVGQGLLTPTLSSAVAGRAGAQRGQWLGWQQSAGGLARVIGPVAAGALFQYIGVGAPYVVGAALAFVALLALPTGRAPAAATPGRDPSSSMHPGP
jgi:MFS transporter, DHA1 family, tetracycline resistance protein